MTPQKNALRSGHLSAALFFLQTALLCFVVLTSPFTLNRVLLYGRDVFSTVPDGFWGITLAIPDFALVALLMVTAVRVLNAPDYRARLYATLEQVTARLGGLFWAVLIIWLAISSLWAIDPYIGRAMVLHSLGAFALGLIAAEYARSGRETPIFWALLISGAAQGLLAVLQLLNNGPLGLGSFGEPGRFWYDTAAFYRGTGLASHPNYLGGCLVTAVFGGLALIFGRAEARRLMPVLVGLLVAVGLGLIASMSRGALIGLFLGLLPLAALIPAVRKRLDNRAILIGGVALATIALWAALVLLPNAQVRLLQGREFFFEDSWSIIQARPFTGTGAANLALVIDTFTTTAETPRLPVHNVYLYVWAESGLPGLALFTLALLMIAWRIRPRAGMIVFIWGAGLVAVGAMMLFDNYWWAVQPFRALLLLVIGLWWGLWLRATPERR